MKFPELNWNWSKPKYPKKKFKQKKETINQELKIFAPPKPLSNEFNSDESQIKKSKNLFNLNLIFNKNFNFPKITFYNLNKYILIFIVSSVAIFTLYLLTIDTKFLVKNINIIYKNGSYLSKSDTEKLKKTFESEHFNIIAKNSIWFQSSFNLTNIGKESNKNITKIDLTKVRLPNTINIEVTTDPIISTLNFNSTEQWRVAKDGSLITKDDINLNEKLLTIIEPVIWNNETFNISNLKLDNLDGQLNKLYFLDFITDKIDKLGYSVSKSEVNNIESNQVFITINNDTQLKFDHTKISLDNLINKVTNTLQNKKIKDEIMTNQIKYIDFRISENIFICKKDKSCE